MHIFILKLPPRPASSVYAVPADTEAGGGAFSCQQADEARTSAELGQGRALGAADFTPHPRKRNISVSFEWVELKTKELTTQKALE